jgi:hypothetical protein
MDYLAIYMCCKVLYFILSEDDFEIKSKIYSLNCVLFWIIYWILKMSCIFGICFLLCSQLVMN